MELALGALWLAAAVATALAVAAPLVRWLHAWALEAGLGKERRARLPPGDFGWPFLGNMTAFLAAFRRGDPDSFISGFVRRFGQTGMYKGFMFSTPTILLTKPDLCKQILMDDEHFVTGWPKSTVELMGKKSFIGISTEEHKRLRKLTSASINGYEALNTYIKFIDEIAVKTLNGWVDMGEIEFLTELRKFTFKIIMRIFMSNEDDGTADALERVYTDLNRGVRAMAINIPGFAYYKALKARRTLVKVLQNALDERRPAASGRRKLPRYERDMMDILIEVEDENGRKLTDEEIIDVLIMYLNAGHESSGHITMWATLFLQENHDMLEKARAEQQNILASRPADQKGLNLRDVRKMEYLSQVIDETLRFVNVSFVSFRKATADMEINGYLIPKNWRVQLWYRTVHMDPEVYPDPKKFDPSRWNGPPPRAGTFLAFGLGSRLCPGNDLAKLEISVFLHHFLLGYKVTRLNPDCPVRYLPHPRPADNCLATITRLKDKAGSVADSL